MTRSIALLGSTGSIGRQTLEVARELGLSVAALTANKSVDLIEQQAREFCPRLAVLYDEDAARELRARLSDTNTEVLSGMEGLLAAATADDADTVSYTHLDVYKRQRPPSATPSTTPPALPSTPFPSPHTFCMPSSARRGSSTTAGRRRSEPCMT